MDLTEWLENPLLDRQLRQIILLKTLIILRVILIL